MQAPAGAAADGAQAASRAPWCWSSLGPTLVEEFPARPGGLVKDLHLILGEQAIGMVRPHVPDDGVALVRASDNDPVGDVVD